MRLQLTQAWIDNLKIHDVDDPTIVYSIRSALRRATPRHVELEHAERDGVDDLTKYYSGQVVDLAGYVSAATVAATDDAYDQLRAAIALPEAHVFRFRRMGRLDDEQATVKLSGGPEAPQEGYGKMVKYTLTLVGEDPRIYSALLRSGSYDPTASLSGGGMPVPMVFPLVFTTTTTSTLVLNNAGTRKTPPVLTVHGPASSGFAIDNETTGQSIYIAANLGSSDVLVIDVAARTVTLNGADRRDLIDPATSSWWEMAPGDNSLRLRGSGMAAGVSLLTVQYRDARI